MSISVTHRVIANAFGRRDGSASRTVIPAVTHQKKEAEAVRQGEFTCSPWEGLYLEQARSMTPRVAADVPVGEELESFLASLMYGE